MMMTNRFRRVLASCALAAIFPVAVSAQQAYPDKPIRIIVPYPPGGSTDIVSRLVAAKMGPAIGQAMIVDNRPGGNALIGAGAVARAAPDGYTILLTTPATHTQSKYLYSKLPFDPEKDFTPITAAVSQSSFLLVNATLPVKTFREFVDYAKRNPGKLSFGTPNRGSSFHLAGELIKDLAGIDMVHIPYKGGAPAQQAIITGEVPVAIFSNTSATAGLKAGKIRALAVLEKKRLKAWPDVPLMTEFLPVFDKPGEWLGVYAPARLPRPILDRLYAEIMKSLNDPDSVARLDAVGMEVFGNSPAEFAALLRHETEVNVRLLKMAGIKPEE